MYTTQNFKTKKALKVAVEDYIKWMAILEAHHSDVKTALVEADWLIARKPITLFAPGLGTPKRDGWETVEGPHYPAPHTWYAQVLMQDGIAVKVK